MQSRWILGLSCLVCLCSGKLVWAQPKESSESPTHLATKATESR